MTDELDPPRLRLSGDSPSDLVGALELARRDLPSAAHLERLGAGVSAALSASGASDASDGSDDASGSELDVKRRRRSMRPLAAGATTSFKFLLAAAVAASGLGAGLWFSFATPLQETPRGAAPESSIAPKAPGRFTPSGTQAMPAENAPAVPADEPRAPVAVPEPKPKSIPSVETDVPGASSAGPPVGAAAFGDPGEAEASLLGRAQQSLAADPASALALTVEHGRSFPRGTLAQEREFIAIEALEALGRHPDAARRAARFRAEYPSSAHLRRLDHLLGMPTDAVPK